MLKSNGRKVKSMEDAEEFIRDFMNETLSRTEESSYGKSYDFDLFLPWMMDWVLNLPQEHDDQDLSETSFLERIYMEAAWSLCQKGFLRPGPRTTIGEDPGGSYGKGYSLTEAGAGWLGQEHQEPTH